MTSKNTNIRTKDKQAFIVMGEPKGKGRPRFCKSGHAYTPKATRDYESEIRAAYLTQYKGRGFGKGVPLSLLIYAVYGVPKSDRKATRKKKLAGAILPTKKPDVDNIIKIVADALNGLAYHDDSQLVEVHCVKAYGETPHISVFIREV
jgi:Holliday junction resolvase RusA-like endonuclease